MTWKLTIWCLALFTVLLASGCAHTRSPEIAENMDSKERADGVCPQLSGKYAYVGNIDGVHENQQKQLTIIYAFPGMDMPGIDQIRYGYRLDNSRSRIFPDIAEVKNLGVRHWRVSVSYQDGFLVGSYDVDLGGKPKFRCNAAELSWTGTTKGSSEFGPNTSYWKRLIRVDKNRDLVYEEFMDVDMSLRVLSIPTGALKSTARYRFRFIEG